MGRATASRTNWPIVKQPREKCPIIPTYSTHILSSNDHMVLVWTTVHSSTKKGNVFISKFEPEVKTFKVESRWPKITVCPSILIHLFSNDDGDDGGTQLQQTLCQACECLRQIVYTRVISCILIKCTLSKT